MLKIPKQPNIKGAILAGGRASRMGGIAKGMIADQNGRPIIAHLINQMRLAGVEDIVIGANDPASYIHLGVQVIPDLQQGVGPIAGIAAVVKYYQNQCDGVLCTPCDVPNITARELIILKEAFLHSKAKVVVAETEDFFWHPLCAVVHNGLADQISLALNSGQRKIGQLWKQLAAESVVFSDRAAFFNMNDLSDLKRWRGNTYD
jgi:molybdopterin-guanine dinucleotide biosynthesis protein A